MIQGLDTAIDQLKHKRATLPAREQLSSAITKIAQLDKEAAAVQVQRDELGRRQSLLEDEVTLVENKVNRETEKLYSGTVTGPKDLQALQVEIASLKRHQSSLEDDIIVVMEEAEPVDAELESIAARKASAEDSRATATAEIETVELEIDLEVEADETARNEAAAAIDPDLLGTYDRIRANLGGVGIARFVGGRCEGCHLSLPAMEVDQLKRAAPGEIITCNSCERILAH